METREKEETSKTMKKSLQQINGDRAEGRAMEFFAERSFFAHLFAKKLGSQPVDIIVSKRNQAGIFDVKHCDTNRFEFSRIEPNQINAFRLWRAKDNLIAGIIIEWSAEDPLDFLPWDTIVDLMEKGEKSIRKGDINLSDLELWERIAWKLC